MKSILTDIIYWLDHSYLISSLYFPPKRNSLSITELSKVPITAECGSAWHVSALHMADGLIPYPFPSQGELLLILLQCPQGLNSLPLDSRKCEISFTGTSELVTLTLGLFKNTAGHCGEVLWSTNLRMEAKLEASRRYAGMGSAGKTSIVWGWDTERLAIRNGIWPEIIAGGTRVSKWFL